MISSQPVRQAQHLPGQRAEPLEVYQAFDVPVIVDKDVARVEVGELEGKGPWRCCRLMYRYENTRSSVLTAIWPRQSISLFTALGWLRKR